MIRLAKVKPSHRVMDVAAGELNEQNNSGKILSMTVGSEEYKI